MPMSRHLWQHSSRTRTCSAEAQRKIIVVTPTTLLATLRALRTSGVMNARAERPRIADRAGAVYDKLVFIEAMEKLGSQLHGTYDNAMNTLTQAVTILFTGQRLWSWGWVKSCPVDCGSGQGRFGRR